MKKILTLCLACLAFAGMAIAQSGSTAPTPKISLAGERIITDTSYSITYHYDTATGAQTDRWVISGNLCTLGHITGSTFNFIEDDNLIVQRGQGWFTITYTGLTPGEYYFSDVTMMVDGGSTARYVATDSFQAADHATGISQKASNVQMAMYPNPCLTKFQISGVATSEEPSTLVMYNMIGQQVKKESFSNDELIDVSVFAKGVYIVCITQGPKTVYTKRLTIN